MGTGTAPLDLVQRSLKIGISFIIGAALVLGVWSVMAPLESAVVADGKFTVASNRRAVQHPQGGVVSQMLVREGDYIDAGEPLLVLEDLELRSELYQVEGRLSAVAARRTRILASLEDDGFNQHPQFQTVDWQYQEQIESSEPNNIVFDNQSAAPGRELAAHNAVIRQDDEPRWKSSWLLTAPQSDGSPNALNSGFNQHPIFQTIDWQHQEHFEAFQASRLLFESQRAALGDEMAAHDAAIQQIDERISGIAHQHEAMQNELVVLSEQLRIMEALHTEGLTPLLEVLEKRREQTQISGQLGALEATMAELRQQKYERQARKSQSRETYYAQSAAELETLQLDLAELTDRYIVARERQQRMVIRAPHSGRVVDVQTERQGGVITPGETVMYLVPDQERLIIEARIAPSDAHDLSTGQKADIRLSSLGYRRTPVLSGRVMVVSADRITDERTGEEYYLAQIALDDEAMDLIPSVELIPGMPAEVMIKKEPRTVMSYLLQPLTDGFARAFRES